MSKTPESPTPPVPDVPGPEIPSAAPRTAEQIAKAERTARLAKALRDNLRRRKAIQPARGRPGN
jgi:hypothetical protein